MAGQMNKMLSYSISTHHLVISVPLNTRFKVLFNNHFKGSPEEILKPDDKVPASQALTILSLCKLHIPFVDSSENCADQTSMQNREKNRPRRKKEKGDRTEQN